MRNTITKLAAIITLFSCIAGPVIAADVLDIGSGARSIALGRTSTSTISDGYGIFGNPAVLTGINIGEIISMAGSMSDDARYALLGYVLPTKYGNFSLGYGGNSIGGLNSTTMDATTGRPAVLSNFDFNNNLLMLGFQNNLSKIISFGARLKYYSKGISNSADGTGAGINADVGLLIKANDRFNLGLAGKNLIPGDAGAVKLHNGQIEEQPAALEIGLGFKAHPRLDLYADLGVNKNIPSAAKLGVEWQLLKNLALRLGAEQKALDTSSSYINGSAGVGCELGLMGIDYAYYYDNLMNSNSRHFVSITIMTPKVSVPKETAKVAETVKPEQAKKVETPKAVIAAPKPLLNLLKK